MQPDSPEPMMVGLAEALLIQIRSIKALLVRDMMMRFGREHLGFLWVVLEPMTLTVGVLFVWSLIRPSYEHGVRLVALVFTGYAPLTLWRHLTSTSLLFRHSSAMLYHRNVTLLDIFVARQVLELCGSTLALVFIYSCLMALQLVEPVYDYGLVLGGWMMMALLSFGAGALIVIATELYDISERIVQPMQYLQLPLSGAFFLVDWLPTGAQRLILLNPLVHCYEMFRAGFFGPSQLTYYSTSYALSWASALSLLGILGICTLKRHMRIV
jgi:capsular polysaccharide transport system permease protein